MYRDRIIELMKEKGYTVKSLSEASGVSVDTIKRITEKGSHDKDSPKVNTLECICKTFGIELWELFYIGEKSLVGLQAEISSVRAERDALIAENAALMERTSRQQERIEGLVDDMLLLFNHCKKKQE